jgi:serine kinase of HPr protein (carbohydrate metabolism regulator)
MIAHAGLIARRSAGSWRAVLIEGPSGAGKSDLALRCLNHGFRLVADDRAILWVSNARLFGRAPESLRGLIEMRGVGVTQVQSLPLAEVALVVRFGVSERLPDLERTEILGVSIPLIRLAPFEASAPAKLSRAWDLFDAAHNRRI